MDEANAAYLFGNVVDRCFLLKWLVINAHPPHTLEKGTIVSDRKLCAFDIEPHIKALH